MASNVKAVSAAHAASLVVGEELLEVGEKSLDRLLAVHLVVARAHVDGRLGRLLLSDDEDEVVLRQLRLAHHLVEGAVRGVDVAVEAGGVQLIAHLLGVLVERGGDRDDDGLPRAKWGGYLMRLAGEAF